MTLEQQVEALREQLEKLTARVVELEGFPQALIDGFANADPIRFTREGEDPVTAGPAGSAAFSSTEQP